MSYTVSWNWDSAPLAQYAEAVLAVPAEIVTAGGQVVAGIAQEHVAVDTSSLKETIDSELVESGPGQATASVNAGDVTGGYKGGGRYHDGGKRAGSPVDYAIDQEYGGGKVSGTPYMTPASEEGWGPVVEIAAEKLAGLQ